MRHRIRAWRFLVIRRQPRAWRNRLEKFLTVREDVATAIAAEQPVVALESTVIAHGLPWPLNLQTASAMEAAVGTMIAAEMAGIPILATGGIGGVHRGGENSMDISADLTELGRTPVAVVCAGAKAILDLPRTLEVLETFGVPVVGYATKEFPAFYSRDSGLQLVHRVDTPEEAAKVIKVQCGSGKRGANEGTKTGILFANPAPSESALPRGEIDAFVAAALRAAETAGVRGKDVTPFLLQEVARLSRGKTLKANIALLVANATLAGQIAVSYHAHA